MTTKAPTAQGISRLLRAAGFERSTSHASRIRGLRDHSPGYEVRSYDSTTVHVRHLLGFSRNEERRRAMLGKYAEAISAAGWQVTEGCMSDLIVTAPEPEPEPDDVGQKVSRASTIPSAGRTSPVAKHNKHQGGVSHDRPDETC